MIFPAGLLAIAEDIARRIPTDQAYENERNICWLAIGKAYLRSGQFGEAVVALNLLTDAQAQAELRIAAAEWSGEHPESGRARDLLRDIVSHIGSWEDRISRKDITDLVKAITRVLGTDAVQVMSWKLRDPFTASTVLVTLAGHLKDPGIRRGTLRSAEEFAKASGPGNRDYALRWVVGGYKEAGLEEDERRALALMSQDLEIMNSREGRIIGDAQRVLADAEKLLQGSAPSDPDSPLLKLQRFLDYGYNDLRVLFLTECSEAGGLNDAAAEQLVSDTAFRRIAPPRPPSIYTDPSNFDLEDLAGSLFGRAIRRRKSDRDLIDGTGYLEIVDWSRFVRTLAELFNNFGEIAPRFSPEQVDQGLWYLLGEPFWLGDHLLSEEIPLPEITALARAMFCPFRDYYFQIADRYSGSAFYMWWDSFSSLGALPAVHDTVIDVLRQILELPHRECTHAALHGLNHLYPDRQAAALIEDYLNRNRQGMSKDEIDFAEACKAGQVQ